MATDTITTTKTLRDPDAIVTSLIALRDELFRGQAHSSAAEDAIAWKINSCLYSGYPERDR